MYQTSKSLAKWARWRHITIALWSQVGSYQERWDKAPDPAELRVLVPLQGAPLHRCHHSQLQTQTSAEFVMLDVRTMLIPIVAASCKDQSLIDRARRIHLPSNGADSGVGAFWDPTLLRHSWGQLQGQTRCHLCFRALRLSSATLQERTELKTGSFSEVQGFAVVHCGYQTPALHHNPATLETLRKDLGFFAWFRISFLFCEVLGRGIDLWEVGLAQNLKFCVQES